MSGASSGRALRRPALRLRSGQDAGQGAAQRAFQGVAQDAAQGGVAQGAGLRAGARVPLPVRLAGLAVVVNLLVSGNLLMMLGIPYALDGGALPEKLHPGTYLALAAFLLWLARERARLPHLLRRERPAVVFLAALAVCFVWSAGTTGKNHLVVFLESFLPAGLLALVLGGAEPAALRRLGRVVLWLLAANVLLALAEAMLHANLITFYLDAKPTVQKAGEFRPTALYDHPLTGAALTMMGCFLAAALPGRPWRWPWGRGWWLGLFLAGLLAFGERSALAVTVVLLGGWYGAALLRRVLTRRLGRADLAGLCAALLVLPAVAALLLTQTAVGDRLIAHSHWDASAEVRSVQWRLLSLMTREEFLFGVTRMRREVLLHQLGLTYPIGVIENFWLLLLTDLGAVGFAVFVAGFLALLLWGWRRATPLGRVMLIGVVLVASGSNSLGRKSNVLTVLVPVLLAGAALAAEERVARGPVAPAAAGRMALKLRYPGTPSAATPWLWPPEGGRPAQ
ncbi:MAG TPA: VpsF family polysaccharide biosynthesis protein [Acetobacteraceae bacterium]|nr:VpsF family polysaccharide biosynthesis protein [Acetobacteraceae bacterium]